MFFDDVNAGSDAIFIDLWGKQIVIHAGCSGSCTLFACMCFSISSIKRTVGLFCRSLQTVLMDGKKRWS